MLDGVSQGPGSEDEDRSGGFELGGWVAPHLDETFFRKAPEWLALADGLLLGRRTYEAFSRDWPQMNDDPFGERMNSLPKYVVTNTLTENDATWNPTTILRGDGAESVGALKKLPGRELQIHGSTSLAASLIAAGLVDTLRLVLAPTILGEGRQFMPNVGTTVGFRLVDHEVAPSGALLLEYAAIGAAQRGDYPGAPTSAM
jgi:dihydrofolate reductase